MYTGQIIPVLENVSACVIYQDNNISFNVQWDVSVYIVIWLYVSVNETFINRSIIDLIHHPHLTPYIIFPMILMLF